MGNKLFTPRDSKSKAIVSPPFYSNLFNLYNYCYKIYNTFFHPVPGTEIIKLFKKNENHLQGGFFMIYLVYLFYRYYFVANFYFIYYIHSLGYFPEYSVLSIQPGCNIKL